MSALKGRRARVLVTGPPVALTTAATTALSGRTVFQVTNTAWRVWPAVGQVLVERSTDGNTWKTVPASEYELDRLFGKVVFAAAQAAGAQIRVSGEYLPLSLAAASKSFSYSLRANLEERNTFDDPDDYVRRRQTLLDVGGSLGRWYELDPYFADALASEEPVVIEIWSSSAAAAPDLRARAHLAQTQVSAEAAGLIEEEVEWEGAADIDGHAVSFP